MLEFWIPSSAFASDLVSSGGEYSILSVLAEAQRHKRIRDGAYHFKELVGWSSLQRSRKVNSNFFARDLTIRFDCIRTLGRRVLQTAGVKL